MLMKSANRGGRKPDGRMTIITKRKLSAQIVHYRLMIKKGYHPKFFQKLVNKALEKQRKLFEEERKFRNVTGE